MKLNGRKTGFLLFFISLAVFVLSSFTVMAREEGLPTELLIFEEVPVVITASKYEQPITEAPSTISIITSEEIRQSGIRNIPELLRSLPGVEIITSKASQTDVGIRGDLGLLYNGLLVMIDGRSVYQDFQGATAWRRLEIGLEEVDRIEIIRGPGSALYGANAFTGVVNIITKSPEKMKGTLVSLSGGNFSSRDLALYHADVKDNFSYKVSGGWEETDRWNNPGEDSMDASRFNGVVEYEIDEKSKFVLSTGMNTGESEIFLSGMGGTYDMDIDSTYLKAEYKHPQGYIRTFWNRNKVEGSRQGAMNLRISALSNVSDLELQHSFDFDFCVGHHVTWGASYRHNTISSGQLDESHESNLFAVYLQDELRLNDKLLLNLGARFDHHPISKEVSPRGSLIYIPKEDHVVRLVAGTSFRAPSYVELYSNTTQGIITFLGNRDLNPEEIVSYDVGYEFPMFKKKAKGRINFFYNEMDKIIEDILIAPLPPTFMYFNDGKKNVRGCEAGLDFLITDWLTGFTNYTYQRVKDGPVGTRNSAPEYKVNTGLRCNFDNGLSAGVTAHYVDTYETDTTMGKVDSYVLLNGRIGYKFPNTDTEIAIAVYNMLHDRLRQYSTGDEVGTKGTLTINCKF
ncbi:MAG: TonB-dependent receptor [Candidatus Omnitrophica bacterium]|nr:TonB-dependent receptor [Candidatus Omnitrophota bacterium]